MWGGGGHVCDREPENRRALQEQLLRSVPHFQTSAPVPSDQSNLLAYFYWISMVIRPSPVPLQERLSWKGTREAVKDPLPTSPRLPTTGPSAWPLCPAPHPRNAAYSGNRAGLWEHDSEQSKRSLQFSGEMQSTEKMIFHRMWRGSAKTERVSFLVERAVSSTTVQICRFPSTPGTAQAPPPAHTHAHWLLGTAQNFQGHKQLLNS